MSSCVSSRPLIDVIPGLSSGDAPCNKAISRRPKFTLAEAGFGARNRFRIAFRRWTEAHDGVTLALCLPAPIGAAVPCCSPRSGLSTATSARARSTRCGSASTAPTPSPHPRQRARRPVADHLLAGPGHLGEVHRAGPARRQPRRGRDPRADRAAAGHGVRWPAAFRRWCSSASSARPCSTATG